jgi:hypothetical protein
MSSSITKFLDASDIDRAISEVAKLSPRSVLLGGAAMQLYGSDRLTRDVDFASASVPSQIIVLKRLSFGGASGRTPSGVPVCFIVRTDDFKALYIDARAKALDLGKPLKIVTPEHLAAMKLVAGRDKDITDLKMLLRLKKASLTRSREIIRRTLGAFAVKEFDSYVAEVEWLRSREGDQ